MTGSPGQRGTAAELNEALARLDKLWERTQPISGLEQAYDRGNVSHEEYQAAIEHNRMVDAAVKRETEVLREIGRRDPAGLSIWAAGRHARLQMARDVIERERPSGRNPLRRLSELLELVGAALPLDVDVESDELSTQLWSVRRVDCLVKDIIAELERQAVEVPPELRPAAPASEESPRALKQEPGVEVPPEVSAGQQVAASRRARRTRQAELRRARLQRFADLLPAGIEWIRTAEDARRVRVAAAEVMKQSYGYSEADRDVKRFIPNIFVWTAHLVHCVDDFEKLCRAVPALVASVPGTREATPIGYVSNYESSQLEANAREAKDLAQFLAGSKC